MSASAIALNRFGLGARPDEPAPADPQRWLLSQFDKYEALPAPWKPLAAHAGARGGLARPAARGAAGSGGPAQRHPRGLPAQGAGRVRGGRGRAHQQRAADLRPLRRAAGALLVQPLRGIGGQAAGGGAGRRLRSRRHPPARAGPLRGPAAGRRAPSGDAAVPGPGAVDRPEQPRGPARRRTASSAARGLNENLAREILELHTLGVRSGYTQEDVTEFARALTGWTLPGDERRATAAAADLPLRARAARARRAHGARPQLCRQAASSRRAPSSTTWSPRPRPRATSPRKLARHFVADDPPPALVRAPGAAPSRARGGDLPSVYRELVDVAGGLAAGARQVQVALGLGDLQPARAGPRRDAGRCRPPT